MFTYVGLIQLTPEGRENLEKAPFYLEKIREIIVADGGVLETVFAVMGPWDFFAIVKYPDTETAFRVLAKIGLLEVVKTERRPIAPGAGLILKRPGEGRCEERALLTDILPDRGFDVAASQRVSWFFVGSHLVSSFV